MSRIVRTVAIVALLAAAAGLAMIRVCADGGAMAAVYRTCECRGLEWELYDRAASDGPRRTLCLGLVRSRTCYRFRTGPTVACADIGPRQ